mgnify:CR=1 FL=1
MFEPSAKNAYKTVKAPESLKKRVEEMACEACDKAARQNPPKETVRSLWQKKLLPAVYTLAACAAAVTIFFASHRQLPQAPVVLVGEENPALAAVAVENGTSVYSLDAPEAETVSLVLTLETGIKTELSVSHGSISDMLTGEPKKTLIFSGDAKLFWDIEDISPAETAYLTVKNAKTGEICSEYAVAKDEETDTWFIRLNQTEDTTEKE